MLYLIKMKLLQEIVDRLSSVNPPKRKFTNMQLDFFFHAIMYMASLTRKLDMDCACVAEIVDYYYR